MRIADVRARTPRITSSLSSGWARLPWYGRGLVYLALIVIVLLLPNDAVGEIMSPESDWATILFYPIGVYILLAIGLNVVVGQAGLLDLGYVAFFAIGGYGMGVLGAKYGVPFWYILPLSILVSSIAGVILGAPTLRLRGDYLAIVTLGFGEIIRITANNTAYLGGPRGITQIPHPPNLTGAQLLTWGSLVLLVLLVLAALAIVPAARDARRAGRPDRVAGQKLAAIGIGALLVVAALVTSLTAAEAVNQAIGGIRFGVVDPRPYYYLVVALCVLVIIAARRFERSRVGRAWAAIREDEDAAELMGVPTFRFKLWAFAVGAAIGGASGTVFASKVIAILPENFPFMLSVLILAAVVLGGSGNLPGVMLGAFLVAWLPERFRAVAEYRVLVFGAALVAMMVFRPEGVLPSRQRKAELEEGTSGMGSLGAEVPAVATGQVEAEPAGIEAKS